MIRVDAFVNCLHDSGVTLFTGVPDSLLKSFCAYVTNTCGKNHVIAGDGWIGGGVFTEYCGNLLWQSSLILLFPDSTNELYQKV